ncbi:phage tail protein [Myxococcus xanthus]|uniref:Phage tail protein n=1 Tax=Myxococcus xanthus TaxID=34 RepID=A0AAE6KTN9_MYXXA|nr:phage tail protein [Myxococcus xanthus]QDE76767.1 phage tail protein [Myxococcus xanthus]QDE98329.1 phage tail protein [Myxococcus xanthus]
MGARVPEYLAPGVYVEETSFRARSIEGVSTSTSGFAGPARKGPVSGTPSLVTSFPEFVRLFGGLADLDLTGTQETTNYLAHSVRAYFNEGGSRLYVARVFSGTPANATAGADVIPNADANLRARFTARFPGRAGNGSIRVREVLAPATVGAMRRAPTGSLVRLNQTAASAARVVGTLPPPFNIPDGTTLTLTFDGNTDVTLTFSGRNAEAAATAELDPTTTFLEANQTLTVTLGGQAQTLTLPTDTPLTPAEVVDALNRQLRGGYARLSGADDAAPVGRLLLGTDTRGTGALIQVSANPQLKLAAQTVDNAADPQSNVSDLGAVSLADIQVLLGANATASVDDNKLVISHPLPGASHSLEVASVSSSALGLDAATSEPGTDGTAGVTWWLKQANDTWSNGSDTLPLPNDTASQFQQLPGDSQFVTLTVTTQDGDGQERLYEGLGVDRAHPRYLGHVLTPSPATLSEQMERMYAFEAGNGVSTFALRTALAAGPFTLTGGSDGSEPSAASYEDAFERLGGVEDISIIAAPGSSAYATAQAVRLGLISAAERRRAYRIAVLDTPRGYGPQDALALRAQVDSTKAALYYPWVVVANPLAGPEAADVPREIALPPSAFLCGIYARSDIERGVFKAPANEVVRGALRFEQDIHFAQQETLNPQGVNCLRFFPGRGYRVWGARTVSSDPEWKYVNVRRYFNFLERSVDEGTQWAVFEPNGERLWANIRETIGSFLENQWRTGALLGTDPKQAFFVRCDRTTMDQNDLDNGRLVCLIGVAVVKPAEFVIFRIGQKTADART